MILARNSNRFCCARAGRLKAGTAVLALTREPLTNVAGQAWTDISKEQELCGTYQQQQLQLQLQQRYIVVLT